MRSILRAAWALFLVLIAVVIQPARADETYTMLKDAATGRVISLALQGYQSSAGAAKSTMTADAVSAQATSFIAQHADELGVSAAPGDLVALTAEVDKFGLGHQRFALRHGGLPVFGGEVYVHVDGTAGVLTLFKTPSITYSSQAARRDRAAYLLLFGNLADWSRTDR